MNWARRDWFAGLVVGIANGFLFFLFPVAAGLLLAGFVVAALVQRRLGAGLSGALIGVGGTWLVVLGRSALQCAEFDALPDAECGQPDLSAWFIAGVAMVVLGTGLAVVGLRRGS